MSQQADFDVLLEQLQRGDPSAAAKIFHQFSRRLVGLARARLDGQLLRKIDPEDVVQSAFGSFFRRYDEGRITADSWDDLWALLALITLRKCGHKLEYFQAARRNTRREVPLTCNSKSSCEEWQAIAREPSPEEAAILNEVLENLYADLEDADCLILELRLLGRSTADICTQSGRSERSVYRLLERIRQRLELTCERDASGTS